MIYGPVRNDDPKLKKYFNCMSSSLGCKVSIEEQTVSQLKRSI